MVFVTIGPVECAKSFLLSIDVVTFELAAIRPALHAFTILHVLSPKATVERAVLMLVEADTAGFVLKPLPMVHVAAYVQQTAITAGLVVEPVAFVEAAVRPDLQSLAFTCVCALSPLTLVDSSVLEEDSTAEFALFSRC